MPFGLKDEVVEKINRVFAVHPEVEEAVLYGSRAKGNQRPGSDIDLTLKGSSLNLQIVNRLSRELDDLLLPYTFDISIFHQIANPELIDHIERVGRVFYRQGG